MQLIDIIFQAYMIWESWSKKDDFSQFLFHSPFPRSRPTMLSLAFAQRFSEFFHLSPRVPWKCLWGAPLKWKEGGGVYGALGPPCFNQSCSMYWGLKVWNHCSDPYLTSWNIFLASLALHRGMLAMILTKLWAPQVELLPLNTQRSALYTAEVCTVDTYDLFDWLIDSWDDVNSWPWDASPSEKRVYGKSWFIFIQYDLGTSDLSYWNHSCSLRQKHGQKELPNIDGFWCRGYLTRSTQASTSC